MGNEFAHQPVLLDEVLDALRLTMPGTGNDVVVLSAEVLGKFNGCSEIEETLAELCW